ncbi:MAG: FKBP-type peptidyl-prolyl cis-trans isomerase [Candidatus Thorarchaeota archaeon]|jgi:FKBP-type peptidyl-prolyl cis-trans isomerase 2
MSEKKAKKKTTAKKAASKKTTKKAAPKKTKKKKEENIVKEGSLIYVDYVAKTKDDGMIFDLTLEEIAKAEGLYSEKDRYEPILVAVGSNWLLEAIEEGLVDMKIDESKTINVPPERGAGVRDSSLVKKIAKLRLEKQGVRIQKGERVTVGREQGVITQVLGRTAILDFNPPLAGKTLVFDVTVKGIVSEPNDKIMAVLKRRLPGVPPDRYSVSVKGKTITIEFPKESRYIQDFQYAEIGVAMDALKVITTAEKVKMIVTYDRPEPPPATEETSA